MKRKVKRFSTGDQVKDDYESSDDAKNLRLAADREAVEYEGEKIAKPLREAEQLKKFTAEPLKMASFKEAFAQARKAGDKTFEYMGKKYTTNLASERTRTPAQEARDDARIFGANAPAEGKTASNLPREARGSADTRTAGQKFAARQERAADVVNRARREQLGMKKGGSVASSASKRADGCATRGKTRGRMV
jgi:hypothetical protein